MIFQSFKFTPTNSASTIQFLRNRLTALRIALKAVFFMSLTQSSTDLVKSNTDLKTPMYSV